MYYACRSCSTNTTLLAFQDVNGFVQLANATSPYSDWSFAQLPTAFDPALRTGLAFQPFYRSGLPDEVNLYHQTSAGNMSLATWRDPVNDPPGGWSAAAQIYGLIPFGSPIAAASSYTNVSSGFESWIEVLSLSDQGIKVSTWLGEINDWEQYYFEPSVMANSTENKKVYGSIAMTADGQAFSVVGKQIEGWQVGDDAVSWSSIGSIDAWP